MEFHLPYPTLSSATRPAHMMVLVVVFPAFMNEHEQFSLCATHGKLDFVYNFGEYENYIWKPLRHSFRISYKNKLQVNVMKLD